MPIITRQLQVGGMQCIGCEAILEEALERLPGVRQVHADYGRELVVIRFDSRRLDAARIAEAIRREGYVCAPVDRRFRPWRRRSLAVVLGLVGLVMIVAGAQWAEQLRLPALDQQLSYGLLFMLGLVTGFHCVGMCGGFVLGYTARNAARGRHSYTLSHVAYGAGKTLSYTTIGGLFGYLGSIFAFTPFLRGGVGILAGIFLVLMGISMLRLFPALRIGFRLPGVLRQFIQKESRRHRSPFAIGLLNGLMIACGPLQALYVMAAGTGSALEGAARLFMFGVGTLPVLLGFGVMASLISHRATDRLLRASAVFVVAIGLVMINRGLVLTGAGYDLRTAATLASSTFDHWLEGWKSGAPAAAGPQIIRMVVTRSGYHPDRFELRQGVPVRWIIEGRDLTYCNRRITVPSLGLEFDIVPGEQVVEFVPNRSGVIPWSCWMGMIPGSFVVSPRPAGTPPR